MSQSTKKARAYSAPKLTEYGSMLKLTASGTGNNPENNPPQPNRPFP